MLSLTPLSAAEESALLELIEDPEGAKLKKSYKLRDDSSSSEDENEDESNVKPTAATGKREKKPKKKPIPGVLIVAGETGSGKTTQVRNLRQLAPSLDLLSSPLLFSLYAFLIFAIVVFFFLFPCRSLSFCSKPATVNQRGTIQA